MQFSHEPNQKSNWHLVYGVKVGVKPCSKPHSTGDYRADRRSTTMPSMKDLENAYETGLCLAVNAQLEKNAAPSTPRLGVFARLLGRGVEETAEKQYQRIMQLPYVQRQLARYPKGTLSTFQSYIQRALRATPEDIPSVWDLSSSARKSLQRRQLLRAVQYGQRAVAAARLDANMARASLAMPLATAGIVASAPSKTAAEKNKSTIPAIGASIAGVAPIAQGLASGALGAPVPKKLHVSNAERLRKMLRPGDILLMSEPGVESPIKIPITMTGGDPYGYHVGTVVSAPKRGMPKIIHSTPAEGGASYVVMPIDTKHDYIVKRLKNRRHVKQFLKNIDKYRAKEDVLEEMLGPLARSRMYDKPAAVRGAVKSFLPRIAQRAITRKTKPLPGATICSSLPGMTCPVDLAPGVPKHEILPHHIQHSPALKTVAHYRALRAPKQKVIESTLRATPWLIRGALGGALGLGAYKGLQALTD